MPSLSSDLLFSPVRRKEIDTIFRKIVETFDSLGNLDEFGFVLDRFCLEKR